MRPTSVLPIFLLLAGLSTNVIAQRTSADAPPPDLATGTRQQSAPPATQTNGNNNNNNNDDDNKGTTAKPDENKTSAPAPSKTNVVITGTAKGGADGDTPDIVTGTAKGPAVTISRNPMATGGAGDDPPPPPPPPNFGGKVPDYPAAAVPDTHRAPYMQRSNLPEGTVFIAVGAALGLFGLIAIAWRTVVAWQLRRSIRHANQRASMSDMKGLLGRQAAPTASKKNFYSAGVGSSVSLDHLGASSRTGQTPNSSLFFSPTANNGSSPAPNRASAYLPAGYYAPAATPGSGSGFNQSRDSLPRRPVTSGSMGVVGTPPASPLLTPIPRKNSPGHHHAMSNASRTSVGVPPGGRTPSTYLEDMLDVPFPQESLQPADSQQDTRRHSRRKSGNGGGYGGYARQR